MAHFLRIISDYMSEQSVALDKRLGIPGTATVFEGNGGIPAACITTPHCSGEIYLLGGQVTRWKPTGAEEVLWLSEHSNYTIGKAIRGGIPICFPWFGAKADDSKAPSHGFVRTREWELESISQTKENVIVSLLTRSDESTKRFWPADFELRLHASFGSRLRLQLQLTNSGRQPLRAEEALHAYFTVGDVREASITGLDATDYLDKTDGNRRKTQSGDIRIGSETDRVYLDTTSNLDVHDPTLNRRIRIEKEYSLNSVVWNPWIDKARALADFGDDEWRNMLCVEPSNVGDRSVEVAPGQQQTMGVSIFVPSF